MNVVFFSGRLPRNKEDWIIEWDLDFFKALVPV